MNDILMWYNQDIKGAKIQMTEDHQVWRRFVASHYGLTDHGTRRRRVI